MASAGVPSSGITATRRVGLFLVLLVGFPGGGTSSQSSQFKVHGLDTVRAGVEAFLICFLEGSVTRPPSYVWVKDGKVIPGQTDMFIRFKVVRREDAGFYQCGAPGSDVGGEGRHLFVEDTTLWSPYTVLSTGLLAFILIVLVLCWFRLPPQVDQRLRAPLLPAQKMRQREDHAAQAQLRPKRGNRDTALKETRPGSHAAPQKSKSEKRKVPPPQDQKVNFDAAYQKGTVHVLPPLQDSKTQQPAGGGGKEQGLETMGSQVVVIQRLHQLLSETVRPDDLPVFLFTQSLPCYTHAIIYHKVFGAIIVKVNILESVDPASRSLLKQAAQNLRNARGRVQEELQEQLHSDGVTLLLALPNLEDKELGEQDKAWMQKRNVQILLGKTEDKYRAWLQSLSTTERPELWGLGGDSNHAFRTGVSRYLSMLTYDDADDPTNWLVTKEQASVLHCTDKLVHVWGPPGSGKTLLLVDRVRRWLLRNHTVVLAVCGSSYELLLHRLGRMVASRISSDTADKVTFCTTIKQLKKTMESLGKGKNPSSICVAIDGINAELLRALLDVYRSSTLESAWTTGRTDFPPSEELVNLGLRRVRLSHTLRFSGPVLQLANKLLPRDANTPAFEAFPHASASLPSSVVSIQRHADHLPASHVNFDCGECDEWLKGVLPPQTTSLTLDDKRWKHWVVLLTGDWGRDSKQLTEKLVGWLTCQGIPAVHDWQLDRHVSNIGVPSVQCSDGGSHDKGDRAATRARVETSVNKEGLPAVTVMEGSLFRGLEKRCVLVVHYDWRDDHADHQSQKQKNTRLAQHRYQLLGAVARCRTTLAVLLFSPSPAASLLPNTHG